MIISHINKNLLCIGIEQNYKEFLEHNEPALLVPESSYEFTLETFNSPVFIFYPMRTVQNTQEMEYMDCGVVNCREMENKSSSVGAAFNLTLEYEILVINRKSLDSLNLCEGINVLTEITINISPFIESDVSSFIPYFLEHQYYKIECVT